MRTAALALVLTLAAALLPAPAAAQQSHLLVVSGLGGEPQYADSFYEWGAAMVDAARQRWGLADSSVVFLAERPERDPARIRARSTRANVERALTELARRAQPGDRVLILLIGHGSAEAGEPRINLPGPDLTAAELADLLAAFSEQDVAVVNAASASGAFLEPLAAAGRLVVTATRNAAERNQTLFGRYFVEAYTGNDADADKDGGVSLLEAFGYARREVERAYEQGNQLLTEHAVLDGDGDGRGAVDAAPAADSPDGRAALAFVLGAAAPSDAVADPALRALEERQRRLERDIAALRAAQDTMDAAAYQRDLERLLLELAEVGRAIRKAGGGGP